MFQSIKYAVLATAILGSAANAVVTVTVEAAGVQSNTQGQTGIVNFDAATTGVNTGLGVVFGTTGITGTIDTVSVLANDIYGGAGGSGKYASVLTNGTTTITLAGTPASYLGFYASAIDGGGTVNIYNGTTLLYTKTLPLVALDASYGGNPSSEGANPFQSYAFFNISSTTPFTSIVLTQGPGGASFEFDNLTIGTVPEPASWALMIAGFAMVGFSMRRRATKVVAA